MLLDEPTNHLDLKHQVEIMGMVDERVRQGTHSAFAALHDINLAARYCTHILMLFGDGDWQAGPVDELLTLENLEKLYQCPVESVQTTAGRRFLPGS